MIKLLNWNLKTEFLRSLVWRVQSAVNVLTRTRCLSTISRCVESSFDSNKAYISSQPYWYSLHLVL